MARTPLHERVGYGALLAYVLLIVVAAVAGYLSLEYAVPQYHHPCAVSPDCGEDDR